MLTHHERETLPVDGDAPFHFVTTGIESALEQARAAAGDRDVMVAGGAQTVRQYLAAGLLDELLLTVTPVLLGTGERLLIDVGDPTFAQVETIVSPSVTHLLVATDDVGDLTRADPAGTSAAGAELSYAEAVGSQAVDHDAGERPDDQRRRECVVVSGGTT